MDFDFSDDQLALRDAVAKWVDKSYDVERRKAIVAAGGVVIDPDVAARLVHRTPSRLAALTRREREVLDLIILGKLNKQIADVLGISIKTVEVHRARVMEKMGAQSLAELVQSVMAIEGVNRG